MQIILYNQSSDVNKLNKTLGTGVTVTGTIKDESSVENPEIILSRAITDNFNYFYIQDLHRYYFVTDKTLEHQRTIITGHVDVLMSFNTAIKNLQIVAERASNNYNIYQVDNEIPMLNYKIMETQHFKNGFSGNSYLIATAGG